MSVIILLHYINEIKNFFTPSAAGFLFESFLAGLIPNAKVKEDNSKCDVYADGKKYQVKLYSSLESSLAIAYEEIKQNVNGTEVVVGINSMDYYLICLKYPDKVDIFILDGKNENSDAYYQNFRTEGINKSGQQVSQVERKFSVSSIVNNCPDSMRFSIDLINLEEKIKKIATGLKESLDDLYAELSNFQYNVETIITGVDERGDIISGQEFTALSGSAESNIESMRIKLEELVTNISGITRTNN
jgi:cell division protein ZapA (FtsZ GTPase activity inhibitor)